MHGIPPETDVTFYALYGVSSFDALLEDGAFAAPKNQDSSFTAIKAGTNAFTAPQKTDAPSSFTEIDATSSFSAPPGKGLTSVMWLNQNRPPGFEQPSSPPETHRDIPEEDQEKEKAWPKRILRRPI